MALQAPPPQFSAHRAENWRPATKKAMMSDLAPFALFDFPTRIVLSTHLRRIVHVSRPDFSNGPARDVRVCARAYGALPPRREPRRGRDVEWRRTSSSRSSARRRTSSPPREARPTATARSRDGHGDRRAERDSSLTDKEKCHHQTLRKRSFYVCQAGLGADPGTAMEARDSAVSVR